MSNTTNHLIIYSSENSTAALQLSQALQSAGQEAMILEKEAEDFSEQLGQVKLPPATNAIFLLTDNFLRSYGCMNGILQATHNWGDVGRLLVLIADGEKIGENGERIAVPTKIDRINKVIQYMNHWQDLYLELRKEKRARPKDEILAEKIAITKEISGDVSEFIRYIKGMGDKCLPIEDFYKKQQLYQKQTPDAAEPTATAPNESKDEQSLIDIIKDSSDAIMAENKKPKKEEEAVPEELLQNIPGMDMLAERSAKGKKEPPKAVETDDTKMFLEDFTKKEMRELDEENDELMNILEEVMEEEGLAESPNAADFEPDLGGDFDIDSLLDEEEEEEEEETDAEKEPLLDIEEGEMIVSLEEEEEEIDEDMESNEILQQAVDFFREGATSTGIGHLSKAVEARPDDTSLRYYHAYALARYASDYSAAESELDSLLKHDSDHPDALFLKGELLENKQDFDNARKCFEKVIEINPSFPDAQYRLGLLLIEHFEEHGKAIAHLKAATEQNDDNEDAHYMLASLIFEKMNEPNQAISHFKKTLDLHPNHPFANYDLALVYHHLNDKEQAIHFYKKAVAINAELKTEQNDIAFGIASLPTETKEAGILLSAEKDPELKILLGEEPATADQEIEEGSFADILNEAAAEKEAATEKPIVAQEAFTQIPIATTLVSDQDEREIKTVLITGATAGIGKATAEIFAKNGHRVILTGRREERLHELSESFEDRYDNECHILAFDVRDADAVKNAIDTLPDEWKNVDILINNAGLSRGLDPIHEGSLEDWSTMIDTNVKGLLYMTRTIAPHMVKRKSGHIINVSSIAGTEVYPGGNVYSASKAAVSSLTRSMRLDLTKHNIRVSQIAPGHVEETEFAQVRFDGDMERAKKLYENFQPLRSSDVAETLYFIASRPPHVNIVDIYMYSSQQANATTIERSGR